MWVLSTDRAELHYFNSPEAIPEGYAILSHVWDSQEQSFQDTQSLHDKCALSGENPRDLASDKVKESCVLAEEHGYKWIWNDTCCIDKTSSAELSEAINSMFKYYSLADVCYAYLRDVAKKREWQDDEDIMTAFRVSRWHERGWTLQELIAPPYVLFLNHDWQVLGSKADLADVIEDITSIPKSVLRFELGLELISVATRMSWAANRRTTRPEDEAYSLLGLFSINMPTLYGEGRYAFQRLQEEIMKNYPDTTLFAWGSCWEYSEEAVTYAGYLARAHLLSDDSYLLAPAPSAFRGCGDILHIMPLAEKSEKPKDRSITNRLRAKSSNQDHVGVPTLSITSHGVRAHIPVVERAGYTIAVFSWFREGIQLGLLLSPSPDSFDPRVPRFNIGVASQEGSCRLVTLGDKPDSFELFGKPASVQWRDVYIAHRPQPGKQPTLIRQATRILMGFSMDAPFRFTQTNLTQFITEHGNLRTAYTTNPVGWTGAEPFPVFFETRHGGRWHPAFHLRLGRCEYFEGDGKPLGTDVPVGKSLGPHWARVIFPRPNALASNKSHDCSTDHVSGWPNHEKTAKVARDLDVSIYRKSRFDIEGVTLSLSPYALYPQDSFVVKLSWVQGARGNDTNVF